MHHDARMDASYFFHLKNNAGVLKVDGIFKTGNHAEHISREINFSYNQANSVYTMTNTKLIKYPIENVDAKKMAEHYPEFFLKEGATITLQFIPFDKHSYNVTFNHSLLFYCYKL
jgi:IS4 transposase